MSRLSNFQRLRGWTAMFTGAVLALLVLVMGAEGIAHQSKSVNVATRAKWTGTALLQEASELVGNEGPRVFWRFIEDWMSDARPAELSDEECLHHILKERTDLVGSSLAPVFHLSLLLRSASPKLVVYRQLAQQSLLGHLPKRTNVTNGGPSKGDQWSVSENPIAPEGQCCWVDIGSDILLEESELKEWLRFTNERSHAQEDEGEVYEFDHVYPGSEGGTFVAILYGALGTPCFGSYHSLLRAASKQGHVKYIYRPVLPSSCASPAERCAQVGAGDTLYLGGYGVELALKNMEYKAIDDSEVKKGDDSEESEQGEAEDLSQEERKPDVDAELMTFRDHLLSSEIDDKFNIGELKDLGYLTVQRIIQAPEPLRLMQEINQNFPKLVSSLSRIQLNSTVKEEISLNQRLVPPGKNLFAINGALVNPDTLDIFSLLELVEGELSVAARIAQLQVPPQYIRKLLKLTDSRESNAFRLDFRSGHVYYLNNIEEDSMYKRWRPNLNEILMPAYPGQMRYVRKNLYHAVYVIDPALPHELKLVETMVYYVQNNIPMRFGVIFVSSKQIKTLESHGGDASAIPETNGEEDASELIIRLFHYFKENMDVQTAFGFLNLVNEEVDGRGEGDEDPVEASVAETIFLDILRAKGKDSQAVLQKIREGDDFKEKVLGSSLLVYKLGLSRMHPCMLMNGLVYGPSQVQNAAITAMNEELPRIQEAVYYGRINYRTDVLDKMLSEGGQPRYSLQIVAAKKDERRYVSLASPVAEGDTVVKRLQYLHHPGTEDDLKPITHWLCVDLSRSSGTHLLQQGLRYLMEGAEKGRIGIVHNLRSVEDSGAYSLLIQVVVIIANSPSRRAKVVPFLQRLLANEELIKTILADRDVTSVNKYVKVVLDLAEEMGLKRDFLEHSLLDPVHKQEIHDEIMEERVFLAQLGLKAGANAVITNGRVFDQVEGSYFVAEDFTLLDSTEYERRVKPVEDIIQDIEWNNVEADELTSEFLSTRIMAVSSSMAARVRSSDSANFEMLRAEDGAFVREVDGAYIHVDAVIDPLSGTGQKITPLLVLLEDWLKPSFRVVFNPMNALTDLPLKNFYRYVMPSKFVITSDGALSPGPVAVFSNMPPSRTLTMNLDVPESWLVEPVVAVYDLDNIVLEKLKNERTMSAIFELEALVVTGHCYEKDGDPPRGLQLLMGTKLHTHLVDTIVMANLGYWQMKAGPGVWTIQLAPGRSTELYTLEGPGEGTDEGSITKLAVVQDFRGKLVRFEVVKRHGKEDQQMLEVNDGDEDDEEVLSRNKKKDGKGFLKWASDLLARGNRAGGHGHGLNSASGDGQANPRRGETINIFSIASGHLYERFLKIMMLSVLKNTNRPVKFWFIKNYLSPQFKDVIPHMAKEYGFEYDLVTYKWPTWLHKQTEKQRIIWAYKILFLDVIFPLSLKKVIFVDADQIVRADMGELYDMDIMGRPLAYTPFCDNNKEMDGYKFWNQGFWKDHLRGKPYHISALYVVDLVKFRQSAGGDNLRVFYESLSKDPNSLSNLDQDLPNYAQHSVPIFSLPQEWLWCESWCGNGTKAQAKTIDLCNNPQTKEPKLEGARRIVAEWPSLDEEARQFTARILGARATEQAADSLVKKQVRKSSDSAVEESNFASEQVQPGFDGVVEESEFVDLESKSEL